MATTTTQVIGSSVIVGTTTDGGTLRQEMLPSGRQITFLCYPPKPTMEERDASRARQARLEQAFVAAGIR